MPDRRGVRERSSQSNQAPITQRRDVGLNIGPASVVPANSYADHTFEYLDDGGAVFLIEPGGPAHLVDLLAQIRHQQRYTKRLGVAGLQFPGPCTKYRSFRPVRSCARACAARGS